ncbi:YceI family protein [Shewanella litorisediminis]|uniref:YceI family protein n=1 Tax=Shewanella litorisediminis TaxID=1173586 RepID=A0ABX7FYZ0_9GAMM|nr:YceI family protein [Shewanella litorisediminis]MCL2918783.1 YceI family protein [Shewanella litorisediminis]QRH00247.1 YceI family protein [Shewanella litorisediminis]
MFIRTLLGAALLVSASGAMADWQLNAANSNVSFISVKKGDVAEVHKFKTLEGKLSEQGDFSLSIPLASVDTGIEIRDERMKSMLFEVEQFPSLTLSAKIEPSLVSALKPGDITKAEIPATLELHGKTDKLNVEVTVARVSDNTLMVSSSAMLIVNAANFGLTAGIEKLREVAGLSAISSAVPVSFVLTLEK